MSKKSIVVAFILGVIAFIIPIEHKYDKLFRFFSLSLIPEGLEVSKQYEKKIYFYISDLLAIFACFWSGLSLRKWLFNPLWLIWLCALFSIALSPFSHYPIPYFRLLQLLTPFLVCSLISHSEEPLKLTRILLISIVSAALFQTGIAITQYFHQAPLGLRLLGETNQTSIFYVKDGARWLFDSLLGRKLENPVIMRAAGTFPHANVLGGFLVFSLLATYYLSIKNKKWLFALPLQFFAMALSYSRSALFAWGLATAVWFFFNRHRALFAIVALSFLISSTLLSEQYFQRGGVVNYNSWVQNSDNVRKVQQQTGLEIVKDHFLFGVGFTQFSERASSYFQNELPSYIKVTAPHNIFLFLACETGLISLVALLSFLFYRIWSFLKAPITAESSLFFALTLGFLFIGLCDFYPILFQQGRLMFFMILGCLTLHTKTKEQETSVMT
jgi:O-antigen ligase